MFVVYYLKRMVSMNQIQEFGSRIGQEFHPDKVVLFGSFASAQATEDSDVDLLVIMEFEGKPWQQATEIRKTLRPAFPLDLLVRTPSQIQQRLDMGDCFIEDITQKGTVLYEAAGA
jgi:predicted nucleotidyltransferase